MSAVPDQELVNNSLHSNMTVRFDERGSELKAKALALQVVQRALQKDPAARYGTAEEMRKALVGLA